MNYELLYNRFIENRRSKQPAADYDVHHVVPRCMGGSNDACNLIRLTHADHFFAHLLLAKIYGGKLTTAVFLMGNLCAEAKLKISRRNFEWVRTAHSEMMSAQQKVLMADQDRRRKISEALKGKPKSQESIARARVTKRNNPKVYSQEEISAMRKRRLGTKASEETKAKMRLAQSGKTMSEGARKKISETVRSDWQRAERRVVAIGRVKSASECENISKAKHGIKHSVDHRAKIASALRGKTLSQETRDKISLAMRGRTKSRETCKKLSDAAKADWLRADRRACRVTP